MYRVAEVVQALSWVQPVEHPEALLREGQRGGPVIRSDRDDGVLVERLALQPYRQQGPLGSRQPRPPVAEVQPVNLSFAAHSGSLSISSRTSLSTATARLAIVGVSNRLLSGRST